MFNLFKPKTSDKVQTELVKTYQDQIRTLRCSIVATEDALSYYKASLAHAEKRVLELQLYQPEGDLNECVTD